MFTGEEILKGAKEAAKYAPPPLSKPPCVHWKVGQKVRVISRSHQYRGRVGDVERVSHSLVTVRFPDDLVSFLPRELELRK